MPDTPMSSTDPDSVDPAHLHEVAVSLARSAADLIRARLAVGPDGTPEPFDISVKTSQTDLVTAVDRAVEAHLVQQLAELRPGDAVLGEEQGAKAGTSHVRWLLDPIDGTVNFVLGMRDFAVSVAAEVNGKVVTGAVLAPLTGDLFHAVLGGGAWLGARPLTGPRPVPLGRAVIGTGFGYDPGRRVGQAQVVAALISRIADIRRVGSAALDLCAVAAGRLDGYFEAGLHPWDWAAGLLVATESGAVSSGLRGRPAGAHMTVAAGPLCAPDLIAALEELDADRVMS